MGREIAQPRMPRISLSFMISRSSPSTLTSVPDHLPNSTRSGFRLSLGGAQQFFEVYADLATFSKAMANGYTISAVTGSAEVFDGLGSTKVSSSFHVNPGDMAAAIGTITRLRDTDALERIWGMGRMFLDRSRPDPG